MALIDGLIAYYNLATNADDNTPAGLDGTASNVSFSGGRGVWGSGGYINLGNISELDFERTDPFSISILAEITSFSQYTILFSKQNPSANFQGYSLYINVTSGTIYFNLSNASGTAIARTTSAPVSLNTPVHIVVTYDGSSTAGGISIYVNGVLATGSTSGTLTSGSIKTIAPANIGNRNNNSENLYWLRTYAQKVGAWNRVLTLAEVTTLYNGGSVLDFPDPAFYDCKISGTAKLNNTPVEGVEVVLVRDSDDEVVATTTTDEDGKYEFLDLSPEQTYTVFIRATIDLVPYTAPALWGVVPVPV